jgi:lipopolysaccharide transport system ATP-binding protein
MSERLVFDSVSKAYPLWEAHQRSLKHLIPRMLSGRVRPEPRYALHDVSFSLSSGDMTALIGPNGAGKSTLLRLASGVARPTRGRIRLSPNTASVLRLGDLFDFTLSGRENAITAAIAAGVSRRRAIEQVGDVAAFAEIEEFIDAPLRTYSDGMRLRLAFGVLAQLDPDVLLLDEVLAVGDLRFQQRCMDFVAERRRRGTTVMLASHSLEQVVDECDRAMWLHRGEVRAVGPAESVVAAYRRAAQDETARRTDARELPGGPLEPGVNRYGSFEIVIDDVELLGGDARPVTEIITGDSLEVRMALRRRAPEGAGHPIIGVTIVRGDDGVVCYDTSTESDGVHVRSVDDGRTVRLVFQRLDLLPGTYHVDVGAYQPDWEYAYDYHWQAYPLRVTGARHGRGVFRAPHRWVVD